ncbi:hypothetical protein MNBD_GAMMA21-252 [hydrothermal vent metagenome]|uniref:Flagellar protein FliT n=1 Tax=hydrothermal vent metagenome TaxID=652676 RepID=A0A3B1A4M7_9ZZZZ
MDVKYISLQHTAEKILRLSKRMLQQAIDKDWDRLARLEVDRGSALKHLFSHPDIEQSLPILSDILFEVLEVDRKCIQITEKERFALLQNLHHKSAQDRAVKLYRENSTG